MAKEGKELEIISEKEVEVRSVHDHLVFKGKLKVAIFLMIKRMEIVIREINVNRGDVLESDDRPDDKEIDTRLKPSIYQKMFDDKRVSNSKSELILDFIYLSFYQIFKGIETMLMKKHT
jgi:hypothetical protein